ncbi:hypothetical protein [Rhodomicrobium lacus]|uniref:hypothetical protein n=1 Tax=Rhodomicrobium lacus TaxID=2498452 RepID=UPI0026E225C8|nr:hypothetical protein [Rhodomicrobium lacus]WKW51401.1 hypothetical protein QMO75_02615 [Rhodomicrobium lacus]
MIIGTFEFSGGSDRDDYLMGFAGHIGVQVKRARINAALQWLSDVGNLDEGGQH